jgi:hypothetical protein
MKKKKQIKDLRTWQEVLDAVPVSEHAKVHAALDKLRALDSARGTK